MGKEQSTIQSLKAVDNWIDVINANINGGVRTGFKSSRLKFGGSNVDIQRAGTATATPLQLPEAGLMTANTVIDFSQGAITASTETTHLAIQGEGFFLVGHASMFDFNNVAGNIDFGCVRDPDTAGVTPKMLLTRDGEFRTDKYGFLVNNFGYYLVVADINAGTNNFDYDGGSNYGDAGTQMRLVYNDIDNPNGPVDTTGGQYPHGTQIYYLSDFLTQIVDPILGGGGGSALVKITNGKQNLKFSQFGSTYYDFGFQMTAGNANNQIDPNIRMIQATTADATILNKSLEASNASMTQSVPELSLAQKLFSALTKVLQTTMTNTDAVLNLIR
jgi:flagellar hook protein FlgE